MDVEAEVDVEWELVTRTVELELKAIDFDAELLYIIAELVIEEVSAVGEPTELVELLIELKAGADEA